MKWEVPSTTVLLNSYTLQSFCCFQQVLDLATSSTGVGLEPGSIETSTAQALWFMLFILVCNVLMTLFIGTIYGTFMYLEMKVGFRKEMNDSPFFS